MAERGLLDEVSDFLGMFDSMSDEPAKRRCPPLCECTACENERAARASALRNGGVIDTEGEAVTGDPTLPQCVAAVNAVALLVASQVGQRGLEHPLTRKAWLDMCERAWVESAKVQ